MHTTPYLNQRMVGVISYGVNMHIHTMLYINNIDFILTITVYEWTNIAHPGLTSGGQ